jgi:flavin-dependent dehydrogenase
MSELSRKVCVIGGGPAGAMSAIKLATLGHDVCLFEAKAFPRRHVGESLSPGIWPLLKSVGIDPIVADAQFQVPGETFLCWAEPQPKSVGEGAKGNGILVDRSVFDQLLLQSARRCGVKILQPCRVHASRENDRWLIHPASGITPSTSSVHAHLLVDASGRKSSLPGRLIRYSPATAALWVHVIDLGDSNASRVEALPEGWCWAAPLNRRKISLMLFCSPSALRLTARRHLEKFLRSRLEATYLFHDLSRSPFLGDVIACDASCAYASEPIGRDFIKIGEANYSLDPLSSTGVEKAMQSGVVGALVAHTLLLHPERAEVCSRFYQERQKEAVSTHARWTAESYSKVARFSEQPFWQARQGAATGSPLPIPGNSLQVILPPVMTRIHLAGCASFKEEPCIVGEEIDSRLALRFPTLNRPVVFLDGVEVAALLATLGTPLTWGELLSQWSHTIPRQQAERIAAWLWERQILCQETVS